jgi:catecholate siderophore receptor
MTFPKTPIATAVLIALNATHTARADDAGFEEILVQGDRRAYTTDELDSLKRGSWLETSQTVTIVPSRLIEERGAATLTEVLRNVSGISLLAGEGGGARGDVFKIRGYDAASDIYLDGVRDLSQYSNRDPFDLEGVEVVKGPSSAYSGRGSTGGAINQVSKAPGPEDFLSTNFSLGTDQYHRGTVDFNQRIGDTAAVRLNGMVHEQSVANREVVELERWGVAPSLTIGLGTDTRYKLDYFYLDQDNITDYGLPSIDGKPVSGIDWANWYGFEDINTEESQFHSGTFRIDHDFSDALTLRSQFRHQKADLLSIVTPPRSPDPVAGTVTNNPNGRNTDNVLSINQTDLSYRFTTGDIEHTLVTGFEISKEDYARTNFSPDQTAPLNSLYQPDPGASYDPTFHATTKVDNTVETKAIYLIDTVEIGEKWIVSGGVRYDWFDADTDTFTAETGITSRFDNQTDMPNYTASVAYRPAENGNVYVSYGTSFNPSAETGTLITGAEDLDPEENESIEVGTKWSLFDHRLDVSAAIFRIEKTNARTRELSSEPFELTGEQRVDGFEVTLSGQITEKWSAFGGYTHLDSEVLESDNPLEEGNPLARTPDNTFNLWTSYLLTPQLSLGFGANYVDNQTVSTTNTSEIASYWLLDASISYEVNDKVDVALNGFNITDEEYIEKAHGGGSHAIPGAARSVLLRVSWRP